MNHNINIYKRLNPKLQVPVEADLDLLHWTNMFNIYLTVIIIKWLTEVSLIFEHI